MCSLFRYPGCCIFFANCPKLVSSSFGSTMNFGSLTWPCGYSGFGAAWKVTLGTPTFFFDFFDFFFSDFDDFDEAWSRLMVNAAPCSLGMVLAAAKADKQAIFKILISFYK